MRSFASGFVSAANENVRNITVTIKDIDNQVLYTSSDIVSVTIQKSVTDGSVGIGFTQSDRLNLQVVSSRKIPRKTWLKLYIAFDDAPAELFGKFVSDECTRDGSIISITAYDAMYFQSKKKVKFKAVPGRGLSALSFPCSMQNMLDYICTLRNFTCGFQCQNFTVGKLPQKGDGSYYTVRELFGFIAACHGCNAHLDANGHLQFKPFEDISYTASAADVIDLTIDDSEPFEVTGVLFTVDNETTIYIDDVPGSDYDEDDPGVISCYNPLATVEIAEYVWTQIGGLSYYGGSLTQRGKGIIEVGDVITTGNLKYPSDTASYPLCVTSINYSISADGGFTETLGSEVVKGESAMPSGVSSSGGSGSGTGIFLDNDRTSVAHNDVEHNTSTCKYDSISGYKNSSSGTSWTVNDIVYSGANTVIGEHNTLTDGTAMFIRGKNNTVTNGGFSDVGGDGNTVQIINASTVNGNGNTVTNVGFSTICGSGITAEMIGESGIFGKGHSITGDNQCRGLFVSGVGGAVTGHSLMFVVANSGNIFTIDTSGNVLAAGSYGTIGSDYAEYFEWADGNPDNEDRCGLLVSLRGNRIVPAHGDDILGAISGRASVIGNAFESYWHGKYLTDVYGRILTDENGEKIISPEYDPDREYIPRSKRREWSVVGLVGRLIVRDNGKCAVGGYVSARNGTAVPTTRRTGIIVLKRVDEAHVEVLIK